MIDNIRNICAKAGEAIMKTYGEDERKNSFSSDKIPKKPLIFKSQTIKIEIFFNSLLSIDFNI